MGLGGEEILPVFWVCTPHISRASCAFRGPLGLVEGLCHMEKHKILSPGMCHGGHICVALEILIIVAWADQLFPRPKEPGVKFDLVTFNPQNH